MKGSLKWIDVDFCWTTCVNSWASSLLPLIAPRRILPRPKHEIPSHSVCLRSKRARRLGSKGVGVYANVTKVSAESRFKKRASVRVKWSTRSETLDKTGRRGIAFGMTIMISFALCDGCFLFAGRARRRTALTAGACSLRCRFRHAHYLFSDSVGLLLVHITGLADGKLRLYHA